MSYSTSFFTPSLPQQRQDVEVNEATGSPGCGMPPPPPPVRDSSPVLPRIKGEVEGKVIGLHGYVLDSTTATSTTRPSHAVSSPGPAHVSEPASHMVKDADPPPACQDPIPFVQNLPVLESRQTAFPTTAGEIDQPAKSRKEDKEMARSAALGTKGSKTPAGKKKKDTASNMRAPRRARGGGGKKGSRGGGAGREKKSSGGGFGPNASSTTAGADADVPMDNESNDGEDAGPYCICRGPDNHEFMIGCDRCSDWFHGRCVGMDKYIGENLVQRYVCPKCREDEGHYLTRYKKMCSLEGCSAPARLYPEVRDDEDEEPAVAPESGAGRQEPSVFCCDEHCQHWWELLIAKLPKGRSVGGEMTQEVFVGLLHASPPAPNGQIGGWRLGQEPFGVTPDFWDNFQPHEVLTAEERAFLDSSAAERRGLGEEMMLCEKMVQLLEMALERRESAIAAVITDSGSAKGAQDICGYDARLDTTGTVTQFAAFVSSPAGEAVFKAGRLDATATPVATNDSPTMVSEELDSIAAAAARATETATAGMCMKKKCKPHAGWNVELTKTVKRQLRELAAQAKQKLDAETRVRDSAASRYQRRLKEHNWVQVMEDPLENQLTGYVAMERKRAGR